MTWPAFFIGWALLTLAFVMGSGWGGRGKVDGELVDDGLEREAKLRGLLEASNRLLEQAVRPKITIMPGVEPPDEPYDWRAIGL